MCLLGFSEEERHTQEEVIEAGVGVTAYKHRNTGLLANSNNWERWRVPEAVLGTSAAVRGIGELFLIGRALSWSSEEINLLFSLEGVAGMTQE